MADPLVSVVVPVYNGERYLRETLESIVRQTCRDIEVLVVDDGSTDRSAAVADSFGPPVRVIRQENQGESVARNRGIDVARGTWIAYCDADDLWVPEKLEKQLAAAAPGVVCVHSEWRGFGEREFTSQMGHVAPEERYSIERILTFRNPFQLSTLIVLRHAEARFPTWTCDGEDAVYCLDVLSYGRAVLVEEPLARIRYHRASQSAAPEMFTRWHRTFDQWLDRNASRWDAEQVKALRAEMLAALIQVTWDMYWKRQWKNFHPLRAYLKRYSGTPEVDRLLARRVFPAWAYAIKDHWDRLGVFRKSSQKGFR